MADPYLDVVGQLLAKPGAEIRAELQRIRSLAGWQPDPLYRDAAAEARRRSQGLLREPFRPAPFVRFAGFPHEADLCDTVRAEYQAGNRSVHVAQTIYVICFHVRNVGGAGPGSALDLASKAANEMLNYPRPVQFTLEGELDGGSWGKRELEGPEPDYPGWRDLMRWWMVADGIAFITLKTIGGPTREVIAPGQQYNASWF